MRNISSSAASSTTSPNPGDEQDLPRAFRATVAGVLLLEIALGLGSNLTVLAFYAQRRSHLVNSVSIFVTVNLHVIDAVVCAVCAPLSVASLLWEVEAGDGGNGGGAGGGGAGAGGGVGGDGWGWTIDGQPASPTDARGSQLAVAHEACVAFAGVSTAANMLAISLDRYDIAVRPARRFMTRARSACALSVVWLLSAVAFLTPFLESNLSALASAGGPHAASAPNATTSGRQQLHRHHHHHHGGGEEQLQQVYHHQQQQQQEHVQPSLLHHQHYQHQVLMMMAGCHWLRYHLALQIPICGGTSVAMLVFYSSLVRALRIRVVPSRMARPDSRGRNSSSNNNNNSHQQHWRRHRNSRHNSIGVGGLALIRNGGTARGADVATDSRSLARVAAAGAVATGAAGGTAAAAAGVAAGGPPGGAGGVGASASVILTLHRAIKRYRQRRKNQRRLFRMSLVIVSTFALCWLPLTLLNAAALWMGPDPRAPCVLARPRALCLAAAYAGPVLHPLLYAFSRQKVRRALAARGVGVGAGLGLGLGAVMRRVEAMRAEDASVGCPLVETQLAAPRPQLQQLQGGLPPPVGRGGLGGATHHSEAR